ncbi:MAG: FAD:protein FMN transferase [Gemmataceae bacterium]
MNRLNFLNPQRMAEAAAKGLGAAQEIQKDLVNTITDTPEEPRPEFSLLNFSRRAMATEFEFRVPVGIGVPPVEAMEEALDEVDRLETQMTVYRDNSELVAINQRAFFESVKIEPGLFELLQLSAKISRDTNGAFDISTGALTKAWGFFRRAGRVPSRGEQLAVLKKVGMRYVAFDATAQTIRFRREGLELNLGSIGKGYALDRATSILRDVWQVPHALLHGGHSSVYGLGSEPGTLKGWQVGLRHPWKPEQRLGFVRLRNRGMGTSAATFQHLEHNGRKLGHVIDPRTGWPAEGLASATAIAPTAALADALATAFFIMGVEKTREYIAKHPDVGTILLPAKEDAQPIVLNIPEDEIQLSSGTGVSNRPQ